MPVAMFAALGFTVALLVTTAYFIMGSIPLLVLKRAARGSTTRARPTATLIQRVTF